MHIRGMVFGVFDGLHGGHTYFLREAASKCDDLVVVVALPETSLALKGRPPALSLSERMQGVRLCDPKFIVIPGDVVPGSWEVLAAYKPDVVFLGYDQKELAKEISTEGVRTETLFAHEPLRFKSSILNRKTGERRDE